MNVEEMRLKILRVVDENDSYSEEDFNKEFYKNYSNDNLKLNINFKNESTNPDPEYATSGSSGFDLRANLTETIKLSPQGGFAIIPTGLYFELPEGFEIQVRSRSGLAAKNQVCVLNSPGTVDADYRGEIKVILINHGLNEFYVENGDRIAQGVIASVIGKNVLTLNTVKEINENTERNSGGFGSTGIK
jgi:dUTP pyrophosphatase